MSALDRNRAGAPARFRLDRDSGKLMGVCAGIGNYFGFDPLWARVGFVAAALAGFGTPVIIYLAIGVIAD
ncbi:MAG: PspC domain-containing protein [Candidatus Andeanibacterium colombiense]|uniref:PspC domain-containing protein n=1 Tax=Candidatus Andeanibacterium colombiense TaxID=3121345 RepID=A0AAJ6BP81_9SPHN|nr:MAG: PspC domain-containing protein [Sphingomonadaceae bacterium]